MLRLPASRLMPGISFAPALPANASAEAIQLGVRLYETPGGLLDLERCLEGGAMKEPSRDDD